RPVPFCSAATSRHTTSARLVVKYSRSPSASGEQFIPASGQSWWRFPRRGEAYCQRNRPSFSRKHISTAASPFTLGSRGLLLLVPTQTRPPATTGLAMPDEPSSAVHLMLCAGRTTLPSTRSSACHSSGAAFSGLTGLRELSRPSIGQSLRAGALAAG